MVQHAISNLHLCKGEQILAPGETSYFIVPLILKSVLSLPILRGGDYFVLFLLPPLITDL